MIKKRGMRRLTHGPMVLSDKQKLKKKACVKLDVMVAGEDTDLNEQ